MVFRCPLWLNMLENYIFSILTKKNVIMKIDIKSPSIRPYSSERVTINNDLWSLSKSAQRAWSLRLSKEFEFCKQCKGTVFYVTFTFMPEKLCFLKRLRLICDTNKHGECIGTKYYENYYLDNNGEKIKCFDNERLSENVCRGLRLLGYKFKYVAFPEFGSDDVYTDDYGHLRKGQKMPHYHSLFFVYDGDINSFRDNTFKLWDSCKDVAFDCVNVIDNFGFSTYVSKYVSKGIDKNIYSDAFFTDIQNCRDELRRYKDCNLDSLPSLITDSLNYCVKFLTYYEHHRPKVLCSNGIGACVYSDDEVFQGKTKINYGDKLVDVAIPSYNLRKQTTIQCKHYVRRFWHIKDGVIKTIPDGSFYGYHYDLTEFGKKCKYNWFHNRYDDFVLRLDFLQNLTKPISKKVHDYMIEHHCDFFKKCWSWSDAVHDVFNQAKSYFPYELLLKGAFYYKYIWSRFSVEHIEYFFGFSPTSFCETVDDKENLLKELQFTVDYGECIVNSMYDIEDDWYKMPSRFNYYYTDDFMLSHQMLRNFVDVLDILFDSYEYEKYLERKAKFDAKRAIKKLYRSK